MSIFFIDSLIVIWIAYDELYDFSKENSLTFFSQKFGSYAKVVTIYKLKGHNFFSFELNLP